MFGRRPLLALVLLAAALHVLGIARTSLPAQDGLKFLRIARQFQTMGWVDVVRGADQHPLYPALVALAEPVAATVLGEGPDTWRIAAQGVAVLAAVALLVPLYGLTRALFDDRIARLAVLIVLVLPLPAAIGHDTLSDSLALLAALLALALGETALRMPGWRAPLGCGIVAGLGYLARPEVLLVPVAVVLTAAVLARGAGQRARVSPRFAALAIAALAMVGSYTLIKGEVSEKLALRLGAKLGPSATTVRKTGQWLPPGLDDPRWDFSPKEEAEEPQTATLATTARRLALQWAEGLGGVFAVFAIWGVARDRFIRTLCKAGGSGDGATDVPWATAMPNEPRTPSGPGRLLIAVYLALFSLVLVRHALRMGYLSDRHTLMLVAATAPWAAAGTFVGARGIAIRLRWGVRTASLARGVGVVALIVAGVTLQAKPAHPSRWGHWAAGRWLAAHSRPTDAVLDTRGWAAFLSQRPSYDYWHVRQAFTDSHLAYIVVGKGELEAKSRRAATLRAVLAFAATPVAEFPLRRGGGEAGVRVYRYRRPASWEGMRP